MSKVTKKEWEMSNFLFHHEEEGPNISWEEKERGRGNGRGSVKE